MFPSNTTRQRRLLASSGVLTIVLVIFFGATEIFFDYRKAIESAFERLETLARIADENISGRMRTINVMLQDVAREAQSVEVERDEKNLQTYMNARVASLEGVRSISVTDANGKAIFTTITTLLGFDASRRPYYTLPLAADDKSRLFIQGPIKATTGATVLFASRAKPLVNGAWDGVVLSSLPPDYFTSVLESVRPREDGFAMLLGIEGTIMARSPGQELFSGRNIAKEAAHSAHVVAGQRMTRARVTTTTDARPSLVVSRTTDFPELVVAVGWTEESILAEWRSRSLLKAGTLGLLVLISTLVLRKFSRYEEELLAQRNFSQQLVETANVMVVGLDRDGTVQVFNETAERSIGIAKADILGHSWFETVAVGEEMTQIGEALRSGKAMPRQFDGPICTKDGRKRIISWQNSSISGQPIVAMSFGIDITDRLEAERERLASQRFLQTIADNMPGMLGYWDMELRCRFANKPYQAWFGKPPEEIVGQTMVNLLGEQLFAMNEPFIRAVLQGEAQRFERVLTKANGEIGYTWAHYIPDRDPAGGVIGFFVLVTDITPLKRVENALRTTTERLSLATKAGGIGIWDYDLASQSLSWDDRMFQLYGVEPITIDLVYDTWRVHCLPDDLPRVEKELAATIRGEATFDTEFRIVTPTNEIRYIKAAAAVERDADGSPTRMIGINWDITVIRENEAALAVAQKAAEEASRAKSDFLANMSHEIRTPMNAILGLSHLLERTRLTGEQRELSAKIQVAGRGLLSIINDVLDYSKIEASRLELDMVDFQLSDLLNAVSTIMSVNASTKDLELVIDVATDIPNALIGDALRLQQVLINLTGNAIKFTAKGGVILRAERVASQDGKLLLRFTVQDTGIGIAQDILPTLFAAFSQADSSITRRYGGSGLGLTICKRLVELMGGQIGVDSQPGFGSRFWFTVPLGVSTKQQPSRPHPTRLDVLVADDHDTAGMVIASMAESLGWSTEIARSGREALERAQGRLRSASPFDVLVLDWQMPEMDGLAVSRIVRSLSGPKQTPIVIMVTAYNREVLLRAPGADDVDAVLVKPVTGSSLYNAVMEARARRAGTTDPLVVELGPTVDSPRLRGVRLLVVEDNDVNQEVARRILELDGAEVTVAANGQEALDRLVADASAFDAVLMDIQMPVMDGYEATRHIRQDLGLASLPIIALTAGALTSERLRAEQAGMNDFIPKPFDVEQMVQSIRRQIPMSKSAESEISNPHSISGKLSDIKVPGIDMRQVSRRLGGDRTLFTSLLTRFVREFADTVPLIRGDLAAENPAGAAYRLHTLRGAAGNIAAIDVMACSHDAEDAVRDGRSSEIPHLLGRLETTLSALVQSVQQCSLPIAIDHREDEGEYPLVRADITALIEALNARSMSAMAAFDQLRPVLARALGQQRFAELSHEIEELMFADAARRIEKILTSQ